MGAGGKGRVCGGGGARRVVGDDKAEPASADSARARVGTAWEQSKELKRGWREEKGKQGRKGGVVAGTSRCFSISSYEIGELTGLHCQVGEGGRGCVCVRLA